jgi:tetratricopeptide (TPR) repeat protein
MNRLTSTWVVLALALSLAAVAAAQSSIRVDGQVFDLQGQPFAGVTVIIKSVGSNQAYTLKADKDGRFAQLVPMGGTYAITILSEKDNINYTEQHPISSGSSAPIVINLKQVAASSSGNPEEAKKAEAAANSFKDMKVHFDAGVAAMADSAQTRQQLASAPADQKSTLQDKIKADGQTAITEFKAAEQATNPKDVKNHALVWANLGQAYDGAGQFQDAADSYQKAIDLQPTAAFYTHLSTATVAAAVALNDPKATSEKVADAGADCDKAAALDATNTTAAATCWKNLGIILNNKGDLKDAILPFQKATQINAKDAQSWFLLGGALTGTIDTKTEGDKVIYVVPPGTTDAYQKCIEADPNGPYAAQAKAALDNLAQLSGGQATTVGEQRKPTKKK